MIELKEGMHQISDAEYFEIDALSNSFLKAFDRSPGHAFTEKEETSAMRLGSFGHAYLLSEYEYNKLIKAPETFNGQPLLNRKNKPYPEFAKQFNDDDEIILHHEQIAFENMKEILLDYTIEYGLKFGDFYNNCKKEITLLYFDPEFQVWLKGKLDLYFPDPDYPIIFDPKFTSNSSKLGKNIVDGDLKYYRQAAFYSDLVYKLCGKMPIFYFIGIESKEPYGINFFELDSDLIDRGQHENRVSIEKYLTWKKGQEEKERIYPSFEGVTKVMKPSWLKD